MEEDQDEAFKLAALQNCFFIATFMHGPQPQSQGTYTVEKYHRFSEVRTD